MKRIIAVAVVICEDYDRHAEHAQTYNSPASMKPSVYHGNEHHGRETDLARAIESALRMMAR